MARFVSKIQNSVKLYLIGRMKKISAETNYSQNIFGSIILMNGILNAEIFNELMHDIEDKSYGL